MSIHEIFAALENSALGLSIAQSSVLFPWIECVHVLSVAATIGMVFVMDFRLLGWGAHRSSAQKLMAELLPYTWGAFAVAAVSGFLLFSSAATSYAANIAFQLKFVGLLFAAINMLIFHFVGARGIMRWDEDKRPPAAARIAGTVSIICWVFVIAAGRWIGFTG